MARYEKKEFASMCHMETNRLSVSINRDKKVVLDADGLIDTANPINAMFLAKYSNKPPKEKQERKPRGPKPVAFTKPPAQDLHFDDDTDDDDTDEDEQESDAPAQTAEPKKRGKDKPFDLADAAKLAIEIEKEKLKKLQKENSRHDIAIHKANGLLIPTQLMERYVVQMARAQTTAFRQALENRLDQLGVRYRLTPEDLARERKIIIDQINAANDDAEKTILSQIKNISKEFSTSKGRQ